MKISTDCSLFKIYLFYFKLELDKCRTVKEGRREEEREREREIGLLSTGSLPKCCNHQNWADAKLQVRSGVQGLDPCSVVSPGHVQGAVSGSGAAWTAAHRGCWHISMLCHRAGPQTLLFKEQPVCHSLH